MSFAMRSLLGVLLVLAAACNSDPGVAQPTPLANPLAEAGTGSTYLVGTTITLDGTASFDPDSSLASFTWSISSKPAISESTIADPTAPMTTFTLDKVGLYDFMLSVSDTDGLRDAGHVSYLAAPPTITVDAGADVTTEWKRSVPLTGSVQVEAEFPATYLWSVVTRPPQSVAKIANPTSLTAGFVPDAEGTFVIRLTATTAHGAASDDKIIVSTIPRDILSYAAVDAEWSAQLQKLVIVSRNPSALHIYDPATKADVAVPINGPPDAVSVRPDGLRAVVAFSGGINVVDLQTATIVRTANGPMNVSDVVYGADNRVHVTITGSFVYVYTVDLASGTMSTQSGGFLGGQFNGGMRARLHPNGVTMYTTDTCCSPDLMYRFDVSTAPITYVRRWSYWGQYQAGTPWFTNDGTTILMGSGALFRASDDPMQDMTYIGALPTNPFYWFADSSVAHQIAAAQAQTILLFDDQTFATVKGIPIPNTPYNGTSYQTYGIVIGWKTDASKLYVLGGLPELGFPWTKNVVYELTP